MRIVERCEWLQYGNIVKRAQYIVIGHQCRLALTEYELTFVALGEAAHECISDEALVHLKSYKYSSVDKSLISNYILKHYVSVRIRCCKRQLTSLVECFR